MILMRVIGKGRIRLTVQSIKRALRKEVERSMFEHAMFVMSKTLPITPMDTGHLRSSWFVRKKTLGSGPTVLIGFAAAYAKEVHDRVGANFQEPGTQALFLEETIEKYENRRFKKMIAAANRAMRMQRGKLR